MPYITNMDRLRFKDGLDKLHPTAAGEVNYIVTEIVFDYFKRNGGRYQQINDVIGALEGAKLEFYRRVAGPYEDTKINENTDVNGYKAFTESLKHD